MMSLSDYYPSPPGDSRQRTAIALRVDAYVPLWSPRTADYECFNIHIVSNCSN